MPGYVPYARRQGLVARPPFDRYFPALERDWQRYLDDGEGFDEAITALVAAVSE
jgi:hypothetical protein